MDQDLEGAVALQTACFPPPFPSELLWQRGHLEQHLVRFPQGQLVAVLGNKVIASASCCLISESNWQRSGDWDSTVGGPNIENHDKNGTTLYGLDISVHPDWRGRGVARSLYQARFALIQQLSLVRFGTACRLPGFRDAATKTIGLSVKQYSEEVASGARSDPTLTPLLRLGCRYLQVIEHYMLDYESDNAAAKLERLP